jgi:hypothetical protein
LYTKLASQFAKFLGKTAASEPWALAERAVLALYKPALRIRRNSCFLPSSDGKRAKKLHILRAFKRTGRARKEQTNENRSATG